MSTLELTKENLPFWLSGKGKLQVSAQTDLANPLPVGSADIVKVDFGATEGGEPFQFGRDKSLKLAVEAGASFAIRPIWNEKNKNDADVLTELHLGDFLDNHPNTFLLYLDTGVKAGGSLAAKYSYGLLSGSVSLEAGMNARYRYIAPAERSASGKDNLHAFMAGIRLPANVVAPPVPGETITFEYGGRLGIGASVGFGYELTGSPSFNIGAIQLSERYKLAITTGLSMGATIAGRFAVQVAGAPEITDGKWARVTVKKIRSSALNIAADVTVGFTGAIEGLPDTPNEFLAAALGTGAKNWINLFTKAKDWSDFDTLKNNLDRLSEDFVGHWIGKAFGVLEESTEFNKLMGGIKKVADSYEKVGDQAVTLFDGYFNRLNILTAKLDEIIKLTSWTQFRGQIDPDLWKIVNQLTNGDPLGWATGKIPGIPDSVASLPELRNRAHKVLALIQDAAHTEIRDLIAKAKKDFGLDALIDRLRAVNSPAKLREIAQDRAGKLLDRLLGEAVDELSKSGPGSAIKRLHDVLVKIDTFEQRVYKVFLDNARDHSFKLALHAAYNSADDRTALVDVYINLASDQGKELMRAAGRGQFENILAVSDQSLVRIKEGLLTHRTSRETSYNINIEGWHHTWNYSGFDRVIIDTEQQIKPAGNGGLLVTTEIVAKKEKERKSKTERTYTNFLVRFLGQSGATTGDAKFEQNREYLIDVLTGMSVSYEILFSDKGTKPAELEYYLSFAEEFGLDQVGATFALLAPALNRTAKGDFGSISADYNVRYSEASLNALANVRFNADVEALIRRTMRELVLVNYAKRGSLSELWNVAWAYNTPAMYELWSKEGGNFTNHSTLTFKPVALGIETLAAGKKELSVRKELLPVLNTLYLIEESMVKGVKALYSLIESKQRTSPLELEAAVSAIMNALKLYDQFDECDNTVFAVFDRLLAAANAGTVSRQSSLELTSEVPSTTGPNDPPTKVTMVFTTGAIQADLEAEKALAAKA